MIDTLEVAVTPQIRLTGGVQYACRTLCKQRSNLYKEKIDLRKIGLPAVLFLGCRYNKTHKLAFVETGNMSMKQIAAFSRKVFECDPRILRSARIDFAADVPGIPLEYFRQFMRVPRKRCLREIGRVSGTKTIYFGSGADLVRVYNKIAERRYHSRFEEGADVSNSPEATMPGGHSILTRVERQYRSGRIPRELLNLGLLYENAAQFNPFEAVVILPGGEDHLDHRRYSWGRYLSGIGLRTLIMELGLAKTWQQLSMCSGGNTDRVFSQLASFMPPTPFLFKSSDLFEIHRNSINRQFVGGGPPDW